MAKKRDYKAEYQRRLQRGLEKGYTPSQARGKPKSGESSISQLKQVTQTIKNALNNPYEAAIKAIKKGTPLATAASTNHISQKKLKDYMKSEGITTKRGSVIRETSKGERKVSQTVIDNDPRVREWYTISGGNKVPIRVDSANASINAQYLNDVEKYARGKMSLSDFQRKWKGQTITTVDGQVIPLDTQPKNIRRARGQSSPNPYRIE
jgi:hypothetical protein